MRHPVVAGVAGGVGTTTVAAALSATDGHVYRSGPVDAVVCRDTVVSLGGAHSLIGHVGTSPVLVVVASCRESTTKPARARIEMVRPHVRAVVTVPWVARWCELVNPHAEAATVLSSSTQEVPKHLRGFAAAMQQARNELVERLRQQPPVPSPPPPPRAPAMRPQAPPG